MTRTNTCRTSRLVAVVVAAALLSIALPDIAIAVDGAIAVGAPRSVTVGDAVEIKAIVTSGNEPVAGAEVELTYQAAFAGEAGPVVLDRESTGADGIALLTYEQRASDNGEMRVTYVGPEEIDVAPVAFEMAVEPAGQQRHQPDVGVSIPWLNGWVVIAVIMIVWGLIVYSAVQLVLVGRGSQDEGVPSALEPVPDAGSTWLSVAFAIVTLVTAIGMVLVFVRNPLTHNNLDTPEGYDRTPVVHVGEQFRYEGPGLDDPALAQSGDPVIDGQYAFFGAGCTGCHGIDGDGGTVGPRLVDEIGSLGGFTEDVRNGPRDMPAYSDEALTEEQLNAIHAFLKSG